MKINLKALLRGLTLLIWPSGIQCLACGQASGGQPLCRECTAILANSRAQTEKDGMIRSVWRYDGIAGQLVRSFKEKGYEDTADLLADGLAQIAGPQPEGTVVTWVCMPEIRRRQKNFDHAELLARALAQRLRLPCEALLKRTNPNDKTTQRGLNREERIRHMQGAFLPAVDPVPASVLVVDDVLTTGATLRAAADALRAGGAKQVTALTVCHGG